jgi:phosphomannomutase
MLVQSSIAVLAYNMLNTSIFKAYDIRGIYPTDINEEAVKQVALACLKILEVKKGEIILAHDGRHGSLELCTAMEKYFELARQNYSKKISVRNAGLTTTPMFYFLVNHFNAVGGCMITASHNPKEYNGVKVVREGAAMVSGTEVLEMIGKVGPEPLFYPTF